MIELVFVVMLLGVFLGMAAPVFRGAYRAVALDVAADRLVGLLAYGRERAVMERSRLRLEIDTATGSYRLLLEDPSAPGDFLPLRESIGRGILLPAGTVLEPGRPYVEFLPDGTVDEGSLTIKGAMNDVRRIDWDSLTGNARVHDPARG